MEVLKIFVAIIILAFGSNACNQDKNKSVISSNSKKKQIISIPSLKFSHYQDVPKQVKDYLDSLYNGKFLIADVGEHWQAGCTVFKDEPQRQFISAYISNNIFEMKYWQGGWASYQTSLKIFLRNEQIIGIE